MVNAIKIDAWICGCCCKTYKDEKDAEVCCDDNANGVLKE